jgi:hypothetical protein
VQSLTGVSLSDRVCFHLQLVCDFADPLVAGKSIYLWNSFDEDRMKDVPFFCFSHLLMRIDIAATCTPRPGVPVGGGIAGLENNPALRVPQPVCCNLARPLPGSLLGSQDDCKATLQPSMIPTHMDHGVTAAELSAATARARVRFATPCGSAT